MIDPGQTAEVEPLTILDSIGIVVVCSALCALFVFPFTLAPSFEVMFRDFGGEPSALTRWVLSKWFAPALATVPAACVAAALGFRRTAPIRERRSLVVAAFVLALGALALCLIGLYLPIVELAGSIQ
jgi:hypothetical protein